MIYQGELSSFKTRSAAVVYVTVDQKMFVYSLLTHRHYGVLNEEIVESFFHLDDTKILLGKCGQILGSAFFEAIDQGLELKETGEVYQLRFYQIWEAMCSGFVCSHFNLSKQQAEQLCFQPTIMTIGSDRKSESGSF